MHKMHSMLLYMLPALLNLQAVISIFDSINPSLTYVRLPLSVCLNIILMTSTRLFLDVNLSSDLISSPVKTKVFWGGGVLTRGWPALAHLVG